MGKAIKEWKFKVKCSLSPRVSNYFSGRVYTEIPFYTEKAANAYAKYHNKHMKFKDAVVVPY